MKTETGIKAVVEVQRCEKLKRRATVRGLTLAEASMIRAINEQFADYSEAMKEVDRRRLLEPYRVTREEEICAMRDKYWPASVFHIYNIVSEDSVLDFCRKKEGVRGKLIEYIKELMGGEKKIYPRRKAEVLRAVLAGMIAGTDVQASCEGESSNLNGESCVGKKRKDAMALDHVGSKTRPRQK
ncbi:hypothetical protein EUTSA_v10012039mg [Eutrema salsugineum]|uniref:Uncharacterized protein n=1 Tax=Eutrema salsugineum TaxID=72664 RepID=V4JYL7_EUTSA|nr:hypothetical protein EUTSA_v10012039mg [Eutrema salsugineum]